MGVISTCYKQSYTHLPTLIHKLFTFMLKDITIHKRLCGHDLTFNTTYGLFSPKQIDDGSVLLTRRTSVKRTDHILDIGCGYGALGVSLAKLASEGSVDMVDKDFVAVEYANKNAAQNDVPHAQAFLSNGLSHIPADKKYNIIVSNIPAKVGNELLHQIFEDAHKHLTNDGRIIIVCIAGLRKFIKRKFIEIYGNSKKLDQYKGYAVMMAYKNAPAEESNETEESK